MQNIDVWFLKGCMYGVVNGYQCIGKGELVLKQLIREILYESLGEKGEVNYMLQKCSNSGYNNENFFKRVKI